MKNWLRKLAIYTILVLCGFLFNVIDAAADQVTNPDVQQLNSMAMEENLVDADTFELGRKGDFWRFREIIQATDKQEGLFNFYQSPDSGDIYWEIQPEQLNKNYLAAVTLESGIGESGIYSGLPLADFLFYLRPVNNHLHFVVRNVKFRTDTTKPEQRSLARSFSDSVLYSLPIDSINPYNHHLLINLHDLLMRDFPGLTPLLKYSLQTDYRLEIDKSYFGKINSFPENVEIDAIYGFSSAEGANLVTLPDSRALTLKVHYSFSQLPENNGYIPRLADDRVGYFITAFQDFSHNDGLDPFVRYINRWHLEPFDPDAAISPPKQPIVFWIENAVPLEYRDAIREGVLMWNKAFAKAGFENAVEVRQMPDDADWQPADVRYNTIRWFNSLDAGFAKGPIRVNPLTGEILDADIIIDANMVRSINQQYRALRNTTTSLGDNSCPTLDKKLHPQGDGVFGHGESGMGHGQEITNALCPMPQATGETTSSTCKGMEFPVAFDKQQDSSEFCYGMESTNQAAFGSLALSLLPQTTPQPELMQEYVHQYLRSVVAHEVGHTLGLRHNFHGSTMLTPEQLNNTAITHTKGLVASVMDYVPVNIAPQGVEQGDYFPWVVGPYDEWAIEYGYKPSPHAALKPYIPEAEKDFLEQIALASPQPELSYSTDEDIWDINPLANVWDMSSDVLVYSQWQMDNARVMWQHLNEHSLAKGESYSNLGVLFNKILQYYFRNATLLSKYIGGQSFQRLHVGNDYSWAFVGVPRDKQNQALTKLQEYVFAEDAFTFSPQLLNQLAPSRWEHWGSMTPSNRLDYPIHERILQFQTRILRSLLDSDRLHRLRDLELKNPDNQVLSIPELFDSLQTGIWTEVFHNAQPKQISSMRRSLQREHLNILLAMLLHQNDLPEDACTLAWYELHQLQRAIDYQLQKFAPQLDIYTIAHLQFSSDRITKALNAQLLSRG